MVKDNNSEGSVTLSPDMEMFKTMLEGAEIDSDEIDNGDFVEVHIERLRVKFNNDGKLMGFEIEG